MTASDTDHAATSHSASTPAGSHTHGRYHWGAIIRIVISLSLAVFLYTIVDKYDFLKLIEEMDIFWLLLAILLMALVRLVMAWRWQWVLTAAGIKVPFLDVLEAIFIGIFMGHVVPGPVSSDIMKGAHLIKNHGSSGQISATLVYDRVAGIYTLIVVALFASLWCDYLGKPMGVTPALLILNGAVIAGFWLATKVNPVAPPQAPNAPTTSFRGRMAQVKNTIIHTLSSLIHTPHNKTLLPAILTFSTLIQFIRCYIFYCMYQAFAMNLSFSYFLLFIPLMFIVVQLPISVGGLGVRETTLVYFFGKVGAPATVSVSVGLAVHLLQFVMPLLLLIPWAIKKVKILPR